METFSHYNKNASPVMVDVSHKNETLRTARASGFIHMDGKTIDLISRDLLPKGSPFEVARIAGIMAAKKASELIPLCHPLVLSFVDVTLEFDQEKSGIRIASEIRLKGKTGAEMEALTAVSVAALTMYDMCKAVDKGMVIEQVRLDEKTGGSSNFIA